MRGKLKPPPALITEPTIPSTYPTLDKLCDDHIELCSYHANARDGKLYQLAQGLLRYVQPPWKPV